MKRELQPARRAAGRLMCSKCEMVQSQVGWRREEKVASVRREEKVARPGAL